MLELRSSSRFPKVNAVSTKAANKLVSFKMWWKWNMLKRNEVESDGTTAQPGSKLQQIQACLGKQRMSTTAKQNADMAPNLKKAKKTIFTHRRKTESLPE